MAAIKVSQFTRQMDRLLAKMPDKLLDSLEGIGLTAKAQIQKRINDTGISASGSAFPPYTPQYRQFKEDVGLYAGHVDLNLGNYSITKRIAAVERRKKKRNKVAKAFGQNGRKTLSKQEKSDLATQRRAKQIPEGSRLWRNINIIEKKTAGSILHVTVGARDNLNKKKLQGLSIKRGDILAVNRKEELNIRRSFGTAFGKLVQETFPR